MAQCPRSSGIFRPGAVRYHEVRSKRAAGGLSGKDTYGEDSTPASEQDQTLARVEDDAIQVAHD
jgi:hypothetical protein